jgi:hypothetical protein
MTTIGALPQEPQNELLSVCKKLAYLIGAGRNMELLLSTLLSLRAQRAQAGACILGLHKERVVTPKSVKSILFPGLSGVEPSSLPFSQLCRYSWKRAWCRTFLTEGRPVGPPMTIRTLIIGLMPAAVLSANSIPGRRKKKTCPA